MGELLQNLSGGSYNLITFDPRGTGDTIPFSCYDSDLEKIQFGTDLSVFARASDKALLGRLWARGTITAQKCSEKQHAVGELVGTAFVARGMMRVAESLEEDGLLRYWGFSYGTTLGATLVSMFPDRVDKVILDGVQTPQEYYHAYADIEEWSDADAELSQIFKCCVPETCQLARNNATAAELENSVWDLVKRLENRPMIVRDQIINRSTLMSLIVEALYDTKYWGNLTKAFDMLINNEIDHGFLEHILHLDIEEAIAEANLAQIQATIGIHCLDRDARAEDLETLMPALTRISNLSRVMDGAANYIHLACAQWKLQPKERYNGNFQVKTKKPVLIIGNTWDGLTPLRSAHNISSSLEASVVLEIKGHGHASLGLPSVCSWKAIMTYWQDGILPQPGTVCNVDGPPFSNVTWADVFDAAENNEESAARGLEARLELRSRSYL